MANTLRFKRGLASGIPTALAGEPLFTTDTFDLYIGNGTTNTRFQKYIASGATTQILRGDGSLYTFPLAISSPSNGQVLKYNGTNWVNDSDAGITGSGAAGQVAYFTGATTQGGSNNLFWDNTNGRLGIGTNSPTVKLSINNGVAGTIANFTDGVAQTFRISTGTGFAAIDNPSAGALAFQIGTTERMRLHATANFSIGSTSDSGQRLQVTGDTLLRGSGNTSATTALLVENSDGTDLLRVRNDGAILITPVGESPYFAGFTGTTQFGAAQRTMGFVWNGGINRPTPSFYFTASSTIGWASSEGNFILTGFTFNPTSGTGVLNTHIISPVINQTGGANGITRGFYVAPTLTSAADWRSIEWSNNTGWGLYGAGTALNYLNGSLLIGSATDSGEKLQVTGTMKVTGASVFGSSVTASGSHAAGSFNAFIIKNTLNSAGSGKISWQGSSNNETWAIAQNQTVGATYLEFNYLGSNKAVLDASGNLGLAVTPSAWSLLTAFDFGNSGSAFLGGSLSVYQNNVYLSSNAYYNSGWKYKNGTNLATNYEQSGGAHQWFNAPSGTAGNAITFTQAMTLDASGNLLVGNTIGTSRLDVAKSASDTLSRANSAMAIGDFVFGAGLMLQQRVSAPYGFMVQATNSTAATFYPLLLQPNGGNVVLGGTSDSGEKLQVTGTAKITGATTFSSSVTALESIYPTNKSSGFSATSIFKNGNKLIIAGGSVGIQFNNSTNTSALGNVFDDGNFYIGTTATNSGYKLDVEGTMRVTSNLTVDTNTLFVDATNNRVGIGTASPSGNLDVISSNDVYQNISTSGNNASAVLSFYNSNGTGDGAAIGYNIAMRFGTITGLNAAGFSEKMRITSGGNLLVGTTTDSGYKLRVNGTSYYDDNARFPNTKGILFENASASAVGSIKMATGGSNPLEITNGTHTVTLATLGTFISSNLLVGASTIGTSSTNTIAVASGTAPSSSATDIFHLYAADVTAGNAAPHFRTENGAVIKLYQETTAVGNSTISVGGGNSVLDDTEFDGYTLRQLVKALRNQGILA